MGYKKSITKEDKMSETFFNGICPFCFIEKEMKKGKCKFCGNYTNFHIAAELENIAIESGKIAVLKSVIKNLPETFLTEQGTLVNINDFFNQLEFSYQGKTSALKKTFIDEGTKTVKKLIEAKQKEVEKKYGVVLDGGNIALIIALENFLNRDMRYYGKITPTIDMQQTEDQELNENGEFVLHRKRFSSNKLLVRVGNSLITAPQSAEIREEEIKGGSLAYIKSKKMPFAIIYIAREHKPNSGIFIFT